MARRWLAQPLLDDLRHNADAPDTIAHSVRQRTVNVCMRGVQAANWVTHCNFSWLRLCHALTYSELQHMTDRTF